MAKKRSIRTASLKHERKYTTLGIRHLFGIDEAGRGPWAGPVSAGAVCLPLERNDLSQALRGVRDSKQMTARQREGLVNTIKEVALAWGIGSASAGEIDELGIVHATRLAMNRALDAAVEQGKIQPECLFIDDMLLPKLYHIPQVSLIEGDSRSLSIAAASVLAKTWRDEVMRELDAEFPQYGFRRHKGYGTAEHQAALALYGPSPLHRMTYRPVRQSLRPNYNSE
jgi:ribonuclease HII